jgi:hypothetical protein
VIALYSKGAGKNGKHAAVPAISNIAAISYVGLQVFQRMHRHIFRPVTSATVCFGTNQYQLLPSTSLLCWLSASPQVKNNNVEIQTDDLRTFGALKRDVKKLEAAVKLFLKQGKGRAAQELATLSEDDNS